MTDLQLKATRDMLGLTQQQLADRLGVTRNTVARWERGEIGLPAFLDLALKELERLSARVKGRRVPGAVYVARVMQEEHLTVRDVELTAKQQGHELSGTTIRIILSGQTTNPGIATVKALAAGLGRSEAEVFSAFGVKTGIEKRGESALNALTINYDRLNPKDKREMQPTIELLNREIHRRLRSQ